jgi:histidinol-phosphate aminotransferase
VIDNETLPESTQPIARPGVLDIAPYIGGESKVPGVNRVIRLASNEGALGPSPKAIEAYKALAGETHRYPDGGSAALRAALAARYGIEAERIVCSSGSDELITMLVRAYAGPGDEVLYSQHGFLMYPIAAKSVGATPIVAPETEFTTDVDAMLAAVTERTKLVFVANPNNPTGTYLSAAEVSRLHAGLPAHVVLVIDAAYAEYVANHDYEPGIELARRSTNTIMIRTFSKIYALGGMRVGWGYAPENIADVLNRIRSPFNVNAAGQAAAVASIEDLDFAERSRAHNDEWLPWTVGQLTALGIVTTPSVGNFVLAHFAESPKHNADAAWEYLRSRGILTRKMGGYGLPGALRITIGTGEEMKAVVDALGQFLGQ